MPQYQITPWKYHSELLQVRQELYMLGDCRAPNDFRRHAVDLIAAWRMRGSLPHAIESTALLVDAILHQNAGSNSAFSVRATYSAAFSRFVTGFCDISQESMGRMSMFDIAKTLDMPASFVELRHEATHKELPSLQRLMSYSKQGIDWLWQYYWSKLDDKVSKRRDGIQSSHRMSLTVETDEDSRSMPSYEEIREILGRFLSARKLEMKASKESFTQTSPSARACVELIDKCRGDKGSLNVVAGIMVAEKMLIPSGRALGDPLTGAFKIWGNLLRRLILHQKLFISVLLEHMKSRVLQPSALNVELDEFREAVALWILHIFQSQAWKQGQIAYEVEVLREPIFREVSCYQNLWAKKIAQGLVESADESFKQAWGALLKAYSEFDEG